MQKQKIMEKKIILSALLAILNYCLVFGQSDVFNGIEILNIDSEKYIVESLESDVFPADFKSDCLNAEDSLFGKFGVWLKYVVELEGTLEFDIIPHNLLNDLDFILYLEDESSYYPKQLRCMLAGPEIKQTTWEEGGCLGLIGMAHSDNSQISLPGCRNSSNYLSRYQAQKGQVFYIYVNNFNSKEGFTIIFTGSAGLNSSHNADKNLFNLNVYPNPTSGSFQSSFLLSENLPEFELSIFDRTGRTLINHHLNDLSPGIKKLDFDISHLTAGLYILQYSFGEKKINRTIIKN